MALMQLVAHSDHSNTSGSGTGNRLPSLSRATFRGTPTCYSVSLMHGLQAGIPVDQDGVYGAAIRLGDAKNEGWCRYLQLHRYGPPDLYEGLVLSGGLSRLSRAGKPPLFFLIGQPTGEVFARIETGHSSVLRAKVPQFVMVAAGDPEYLDSGVVKSRVGDVSSYESFWALRNGDALGIFFVDGSFRLLRRRGEALLLQQNEEERKRLLAEREEEARKGRVNDALRLAELFPKPLSRDEIVAFGEGETDLEAREVFFGSICDTGMRLLEEGSKGTAWEKFHIYLMHVLADHADKGRMLPEAADFLRRLPLAIPLSVMDKLPSAPRVQAAFTKERADREAKRKALREVRLMAQPSKGASYGQGKQVTNWDDPRNASRKRKLEQRK